MYFLKLSFENTNFKRKSNKPLLHGHTHTGTGDSSEYRIIASNPTRSANWLSCEISFHACRVIPSRKGSYSFLSARWSGSKICRTSTLLLQIPSGNFANLYLWADFYVKTKQRFPSIHSYANTLPTHTLVPRVKKFYISRLIYGFACAAMYQH